MQNRSQKPPCSSLNRKKTIDLRFAFVGDGFASLRSVRLPKEVDGKSIQVSLHNDPKEIPPNCDGVVYLADNTPTKPLASNTQVLSQKFSDYLAKLRDQKTASPMITHRTTEITNFAGKPELGKINKAIREECNAFVAQIFNDGDPFKVDFD